MPNRSKKNIFDKEANDTLKKVLVSPEFRNHMMELMTGTKPKNGTISLEWSLSNRTYIDLEDEYNKKLAQYITELRHEMKDRLDSNVVANKVDRVKERHKVIIPAELFDAYWDEKIALDADLGKYRKMSYAYTDDRRRIVNEYIYSAESVLQNIYGSPLPVKKFYIEDYKTVLKLYDEHREDYDLAYPSFPEEFLR